MMRFYAVFVGLLLNLLMLNYAKASNEAFKNGIGRLQFGLTSQQVQSLIYNGPNPYIKRMPRADEFRGDVRYLMVNQSQIPWLNQDTGLSYCLSENSRVLLFFTHNRLIRISLRYWGRNTCGEPTNIATKFARSLGSDILGYGNGRGFVAREARAIVAGGTTGDGMEVIDVAKVGAPAPPNSLWYGQVGAQEAASPRSGEFAAAIGRTGYGRCHMGACSFFIIYKSTPVGTSFDGTMYELSAKTWSEAYPSSSHASNPKKDFTDENFMVFCSKERPRFFGGLENGKWLNSRLLRPGDGHAIGGVNEDAYLFYYASCHNIISRTPLSVPAARRLGYKFDIDDRFDFSEEDNTQPSDILGHPIVSSGSIPMKPGVAASSWR